MTGRRATTDIRPGRYSLSVGMPPKPAPSGWHWVALNEVATMATGHTPSRRHPEYWNGDIPWINVGDARGVDGGVIHNTSERTNAMGIENSAAVILPAGTVCLSRTGSIGYAIVLGREMATSQGFVNWICGPRLIPRFLQMIFLAERAFLHAISEGVAHTTIYFPEAKAFHICLPPIAVQQQIVDRVDEDLSRLNQATDALTRVIANLRRYRAAVLKAACEGTLVPTEAVLARAEGRNYETGDQLLERILTARRENWTGKGKYKAPASPDTTGLPSLSEGWTWATPDQICEVVASGSTPTADKMSRGDGEVPFLKVYNLTFGATLDFSVKPTFIPRAIHDGPLARSKAIPGDVLMNIVGPPLGKVSLVPADYPEWNINQAIVVFRPTSAITNRFLAVAFRSPEFLRRIEATAKATAGQFNVQVTTCRRIAVALPPLAEQHRIVAEVDRRLSVIDELETLVKTNLARAGRLRQSILAKAFSGDLVPSEAG